MKRAVPCVIFLSDEISQHCGLVPVRLLVLKFLQCLARAPHLF